MIDIVQGLGVPDEDDSRRHLWYDGNAGCK